MPALADAGLITVRKAISDGRQRTWTAMTGKGRTAFDAHVFALHRILPRDA
ncbi:transcriptional regulator [Sphingomonas sp. PAMC 26617]|uniref:transcriptional regulator n=1 Tax=Sphingomonas sp. PAMC 26617 TaxID=1112216 RepID=UPI00028A1858|nr:transcriptional regulator [Sphingomonas sp. PAMC 26617]